MTTATYPHELTDALAILGQQKAEYPADMMQKQLDTFLAHYASVSAEMQEEIASALAELDIWLQENDPDRVDGNSTVSEAQDARNSRPYPY